MVIFFDLEHFNLRFVSNLDIRISDFRFARMGGSHWSEAQVDGSAQ